MIPIPHPLRKLVLPEFMIKPEQKLGDSYPAGEMYRSFIRIA